MGVLTSMYESLTSIIATILAYTILAPLYLISYILGLVVKK